MTAPSAFTGNAAAAPPRLQLSGISKRYPGVVANSDIALSVRPGQIHAVLGVVQSWVTRAVRIVAVERYCCPSQEPVITHEFIRLPGSQAARSRPN